MEEATWEEDIIMSIDQVKIVGNKCDVKAASGLWQVKTDTRILHSTALNMPKRKNPFGDSAPIQLKTHVGFNQAATLADKQAVYGECILFNAHPPLAS